MQIPIIPRRGSYGSIPRINWDHPLTVGLIGCYLPGVLRGYALVGPALSNGNGGAGAQGITQDGASLKSTTSGSSRGLVATAPSNFKTWTGMTQYWRGVLNGNCDPYCNLFGVSYTDSDTNPYIHLAISGDSDGYARLRAFYNAGGSGVTGPSVDVTGRYGQVVSFATSALVGGLINFYVNGVPLGSPNSLTALPISSANSKVVLNQGIDAVNRSPNADCTAAYIWSRELTGVELKLLHDDPYCFLIYPEDEIFSRLVGGVAVTLFNAIDEVLASDSDYIVSSTNPVNDVCEIRISDPGSAPAEPAKVRYRYWRTGSGGSMELRVRLLQGATQIASWTHSAITTTPTTVEQTLTSPQFASITDFTDLRLEFRANKT